MAPLQLLRSTSTAFITGAGSGIGQTITYAFARHGIRSFGLCDISEESLTKTVNELKKLVPDGLKVEAIKMDVANENEVNDAVKRTVEKLGSLDIAVNNAGIGGPLKPSPEYTTEEWNRVINVNMNVSSLDGHKQYRQQL
jgi:NAD(P)-dependent dehydrogenase (short-subunit alcohol dehydrogenase family)